MTSLDSLYASLKELREDWHEVWGPATGGSPEQREAAKQWLDDREVALYDEWVRDSLRLGEVR
jgi:hypothetical protein